MARVLIKLIAIARRQLLALSGYFDATTIALYELTPTEAFVVRSRYMRCVAILLAATGFAQSPSFDAASVKSSTGAGTITGVRADPGSFRARNVSLKDLIGFAYRVQESQISGGTAWVDGERYDIEAKTEAPTSPEQQALMLRTLLRDRFHLEVRNESKELRAYVLTPAKSGARLSQVKVGPDGIPERAGATMEGLAGTISRMLKLPVVDWTGIEGTYDIDGFLQ
jgi:uncharacterized protein (TIGR03435 family)